MDTPLKFPLIGIGGLAGSGKSTAAKLLVDLDPRYKIVKFAGPLKAMLTSLYEFAGLEPEEIEDRLEGVLKEYPDTVLSGISPRRAMQTLGTDWGRKMIDSKLWVGLWSRRVRVLLDAGFGVVVDDLRFPNEEDRLRRFGAVFLDVKRPLDQRLVQAPRTRSHVSEGHQIEADWTILNNGTPEALRESIRKLIVS